MDEALNRKLRILADADATNDADMLVASAKLYGSYGLSRVYYSAFTPIPSASKALPVKPPPLQRENRLHQADRLYRHDSFGADAPRVEQMSLF